MTTHTRVVIGGVALLLALLVAAIATLHWSGVRIVQGLVVDGVGRPLTGGRVQVHAREGYSSYAWKDTETDEMGRYRIVGIPPRPQVQVSATAAGYAKRCSESVEVASGHVLSIEDLVLPLADSFVAGRVTDREGHPLAGVNIDCRIGTSDHKLVNTGSDGTYRIHGIPSVDSLRVYARHTGYLRDWRQNVQAGSERVDFQLARERPPPVKVIAKLGHPAPEPVMEIWLNAASMKLSDLRDKVVLIQFWTMYSRPCVQSMETLRLLHERYANRLAVLAIHDRSASVEEVRQFAAARKLSFAIGLVKSTKDDGWAGETFRAFGVRALPVSFLIDRKGILRQSGVTEGIKDKVDALVQEQP